MAPYLADGHDNNYRGFWSQTASIDWCESNYELSHYIAEFWNTLSNLAFIIPQLYQYQALRRHKSIEKSYSGAFLSIALVGIGSLCFHMTLARPMQMFDETSMILVSLHGFYLLYIIRRPEVNRLHLAALLTLYGLVFLSFYVFLVAWPIFHHTAFGILVYASVAVGFRLKCLHGSHYKFWTVLIMYHLGFAFWLIDKNYCEALTQIRNHHVPMFLKPIFQFHALWHLLMGLGSHVFICGLVQLHAWTRYKETYVIRFKWFGLWIQLDKIENSFPKKEKLKLESAFSNKSTIDTINTGLKPRHIARDDTNTGGLDLNQNQVPLTADYNNLSKQT